MTRHIPVLLLERSLLLPLVTLLVAGCATVYEGRLDPALFPRSSAQADGRLAAQIAVVADVAPTNVTYKLEWLEPKLVVPIGEIVTAATAAALSDEFGQIVVQRPNAETANEATRSVAHIIVVVPHVAQFALHDERETVLLPPPLFPAAVLSRQVRLVVDWQLLAADGRLLWAKRYDSGDVKLPYRTTAEREITHEQRSVRLAHGMAYKLMHQAAQDVRSWRVAERLRDRVL